MLQNAKSAKAVSFQLTRTAALDLQAARDAGYNVLSFDELMAAGEAAPAEPVPPSASDLCTIMYTSGTTGDPKGVLIKHEAVVATVSSLQSFLGAVGMTFGPDDSTLSYLPLAHIFDRWVAGLGGASND